MNFPADTVAPAAPYQQLTDCFNRTPTHVLKGKTDYLLVFNDEEEIRNLIPDLVALSKVDARGVITTAKGERSDFVSRFFAPQVGVDEDPVTGSAHTSLTPYWASVLGKTELSAIQLSKRQGILQCKLAGDRVELSGKCKLYLTGHIHL